MRGDKVRQIAFEHDDARSRNCLEVSLSISSMFPVLDVGLSSVTLLSMLSQRKEVKGTAWKQSSGTD